MALNVLVADDSSVARRMLLKILRMGGFELGQVVEVSDGTAALQAFETADVDLAMLDINMPGKNGLEVLDSLRSDEKTRRLPVIVVSSEGSTKRAARIREQNALFVRKPFTPESIVDAVVDAMGGGCG